MAFFSGMTVGQTSTPGYFRYRASPFLMYLISAVHDCSPETFAVFWVTQISTEEWKKRLKMNPNTSGITITELPSCVTPQSREAVKAGIFCMLKTLRLLMGSRRLVHYIAKLTGRLRPVLL